MLVAQDDIESWFSQPVTQAYLRVIKARQDEIYQERLFFDGDPNRTQEAMAWRNGAGDMLQEILDMQDEKTIYFNGEEDHGKHIGDTPQGQPGTG